MYCVRHDAGSAYRVTFVEPYPAWARSWPWKLGDPLGAKPFSLSYDFHILSGSDLLI
ncbi:hypothetical protein FA13DRAFT_1732740 [Coprinellus micaceus]|uniref:Uncharacterized protein n=1 Tax=Coprinellus micaceus TaxID=71717 RepID=A0A4Y7TAT9_COPMI|nr:hypothetical protein FA13DRAFT_1732740 [Coprinellus micaceus]